jgi:hypothetical protein
MEEFQDEIGKGADAPEDVISAAEEQND